MRTDYVYNRKHKEIASTNLQCTPEECKETGCSFPDCSKEVIRTDTDQDFDAYLKKLKDAGFTLKEVGF